VEEFVIPDEVRNVLPAVGGAILLGISPDKADGLSDAEMRELERMGPGFFSLLEGRQLPEGFAKHFRDEVLRDMRLIRQDPAAREAARREIQRVLVDPQLRDQLYRPGGPTFSDILQDEARKANGGFFRTPAKPGERQRAARAGRNRRQ
jgi:hypothetical protein